jgi:hypothetical protein
MKDGLKVVESGEDTMERYLWRQRHAALDCSTLEGMEALPFAALPVFTLLLSYRYVTMAGRQREARKKTAPKYCP